MNVRILYTCMFALPFDAKESYKYKNILINFIIIKGCLEASDILDTQFKWKHIQIIFY